MPEYMMVVFTNPKDGREDEFNAWYSDQHLKDVLKVPGLKSAQRFEFAGAPSGEAPSHKYLALYKLEADDWRTAAQAIGQAVGSGAMVMSDSLDTTTVKNFYVTPLTEEVSSS